MWHQLNANAIKKADTDTKKERGRDRDGDKPRLEVKRIRSKVCPIAFKPDQIAEKKRNNRKTK